MSGRSGRSLGSAAATVRLGRRILTSSGRLLLQLSERHSAVDKLSA